MKHGFTPYKEITEQPSLIKNGQMKQYQLKGLSFLVWLYENGMGGVLGDEMGLGKTLQTYILRMNLVTVAYRYLHTFANPGYKARFLSFVHFQFLHHG
jgi:SNF2 family DNA or RNA helicase